MSLPLNDTVIEEAIEPYTIEWFRNLSVSGGGNNFGTVRVVGTDVVADGPGDVLTLSAGSNISISANATTDTITISATGGGTVSDAFDFGTFASPADFTLDFGTY